MSKLDFGKFVKNRLASFVDFDNTGTDLVGDFVQNVIVELANRHFGKQYGFTKDLVGGTTNQNTFNPFLTLTLVNAPIGTYRVQFSADIVSSKSNTSSETELNIGGNQEEVVTQDGSESTSLMGFVGNYNHTVASDLVIQINSRRTAGNGFVSVDGLRLEAWRIT